MRTAPNSPPTDDILRLVRSAWALDAPQATYLPVGFGAHHWHVDGPSVPTLFATLDDETYEISPRMREATSR